MVTNNCRGYYIFQHRSKQTVCSYSIWKETPNFYSMALFMNFLSQSQLNHLFSLRHGIVLNAKASLDADPAGCISSPVQTISFTTKLRQQTPIRGSGIYQPPHWDFNYVESIKQQFAVNILFTIFWSCFEDEFLGFFLFLFLNYAPFSISILHHEHILWTSLANLLEVSAESTGKTIHGSIMPSGNCM